MASSRFRWATAFTLILSIPVGVPLDALAWVPYPTSDWAMLEGAEGSASEN